ncbi:MAG TPA: NAD(P)H nitroreductase [Mycobacteriales bacterium]|nr:NAD(P)H nitroreductase [Mycobacteriales bacterium]
MNSTTEKPGADVMRHAVEIAARAPSIHNTQPWKWRIGPLRLDLFADRTRQLDIVDTAGRAILVSCGAALFQARIALEAAGWDTSVDRLPDPADPDHLATITITGPAAPDPKARRLVQVARERRTDRRPFLDRPLDEQARAELAGAATAEDCMLHPVLGHDDRVTLIVAIGRADEIESADPAYRAETRHWSGRADGATDGVPATAAPPPQQRQSDVPVRDFAGERTATRPDQIERAAMFVLASEGDSARHRLRAGEALAHVLLVAAETGLAAAPYTQPLEIPATMTLLHGVLGGLGQPQMLLRIGWPGEGPPPPLTPRRSVDDVLIG